MTTAIPPEGGWADPPERPTLTTRGTIVKTLQSMDVRTVSEEVDVVNTMPAEMEPMEGEEGVGQAAVLLRRPIF